MNSANTLNLVLHPLHRISPQDCLFLFWCQTPTLRPHKCTLLSASFPSTLSLFLPPFPHLLILHNININATISITLNLPTISSPTPSSNHVRTRFVIPDRAVHHDVTLHGVECFDHNLVGLQVDSKSQPQDHSVMH